MRKLKYHNAQIKKIVDTLSNLGELERNEYDMKFTASSISNLSTAKLFLNKEIKPSDALGFQIDYSGKMQVITIFTDSI